MTCSSSSAAAATATADRRDARDGGVAALHQNSRPQAEAQMPGVPVEGAGGGVGEVGEPDNVLIYLSVSQ